MPKPRVQVATLPVIAGFFPDPSICRVGDDYYLACSSFEYAPGVPIFHSTNLVEWTQIGNALTRPAQLRLADATPSAGIYAPTLRYHVGRDGRGKFYLITTNVCDGPGQLLFTAEHPSGPWSDPVRIPEAGGIDPDIFFFDDDD
ncbi:MAG: family 43 glycosylhydrolase, partial [Promicromonosporaceae bacterium]|nr:family 43 glycosylhydrolase [Promicromonosporaceae bacterium]